MRHKTQTEFEIVRIDRIHGQQETVVGDAGAFHKLTVNQFNGSDSFQVRTGSVMP